MRERRVPYSLSVRPCGRPPRFDGRNSASQISGDAADLGAAAARNQAALQQRLLDRGYSQQQINDAFAKLHQANRAKGLY